MARVLVVDDNESIRRLITRVLERNDIDVEEAHDGTDALEKLGQVEYDAILLDLMMPRLSGYDVIRELRETRPELLKRFVVMTAATSKASDETLLQGVHAIVTKPFSISELSDLIADCIEK